eukprot:GFUD01104358.1.p1 GENE.GFUD01104358.1~~GFUD01104358.1.p1  ORF type:complete len:242 (-),score=60.62 GFUD01104358.1:54-779(-)
MDAALQSIRYLFADAEDIKKERRAQLLQGKLFPIPSLRNLAFQTLVLNTFPVEEFLPGEGYREDASNLRLLTRDCVGMYRLVSMKDSFIYADKTEASEEKKTFFRREVLNTMGPVEVLKTGAKDWEMNGMLSFNPAGFRRSVRSAQSELTCQAWIEDSTLVIHRSAVDYSKGVNAMRNNGVVGNDVDIKDEEKFGVDCRHLVTFFKDQFVYEETTVSRSKCKCKCEDCYYEYKAEAWYAKM